MTHESAPIGARSARDFLTMVRPQLYGSDRPGRVRDPIVEPLWIGIRAMAAIDAQGAVVVDENGVPIEGSGAIVEDLVGRAGASGLVLDGYITKQTSHPVDAILWPDEMPSVGKLVGLRRNRALDAVALKEKALADRSFDPDDAYSFVVIDLVWVDDTPLLDIPLLERRRLLDGLLVESDLVRLGAYVRPPIETWVASWRYQGFGGLTYKAANSRYLPGEANAEWALAGMPRR
jgi:hypothetical protein